MRRLKVYSSLFWLLLAIVTCREALRLKMGQFDQPGPGFFPLIIGIVIGLLAIIALFQSIRGREEKTAGVRSEPLRWVNIIIILASLLAYALSLEKIGFMINTFLFITLMVKIIEPQSWKRSILAGVLTAVLSDLVFNMILSAQIPSGILGF